MASVKVRFHDKVKGQELDRVQGEVAFGKSGETLNPSDFELKTIWAIQLTAKTAVKNLFGSVSSPGVQGNSVILSGSIASGTTGAYFNLVGA